MDRAKIKVLYIFANERKRMEKEWRAGELPDTYFIGLNHLAAHGIEASYLENVFINYFHNLNYNLANLVLLFKIRNYDIVFTGASLYLIFFAKFLLGFKHPKFVFYNTYLTNLLKRNKSGIKKWIIIRSIKLIDIIICPSIAQKKYLEESGFNSKKIFFIPTGVDVDFFAKQCLVEKSAEKFILSVGKDMGRDYRTLIEAVRGLPVKVKIIALPRNIPNDIELPANVTVEHLSFQNLIKLYKSCEFVVIPTKKPDSYDGSDCSGHYVLLDAMASSKAVIASKRETINDYIINGEEGLLVEPENSMELKKSIEKLLSDPQQVGNIGSNAQKKVNASFTTKLFAEKLSEVFKSLMV